MKFAFWEKAWYYDYNHRFPESPWKPCKFIGLADHQGDQFTYKVWTITDLATEKWEGGRDLTRDIVIPRLSNNPPQRQTFSPLNLTMLCSLNPVNNAINERLANHGAKPTGSTRPTTPRDRTTTGGPKRNHESGRLV